ncbi:MAG: putative Ig domain-containing protein [Proteobacteria bacterium]|nr:putative Ig domain-containing protein [Pseudomonadota bacterium]
MRPTQPSPQSSWSHYAKAAAVFTLTTATYLLARTTGWLPGWFSDAESPGDIDQSSALTTSSAETSIIIPPLQKEAVITSPFSSLANLQPTELTDITITEEDVDQLKSSSTPRRLLQQQNQQNSLKVVNPIPDQVIPMGQLWRYPVSDVFSSGNPYVLGATQAGRLLPSWLSLQYELRSTYPAGSGGSANGVAVSGSTVLVADGFAGLQVLNVSNPSAPILLSTYLASPGQAYGVAVSGSTVFVAYVDALLVLDVSNTSLPILRSTYPVGSGYAYGVAVSGSTVFVADGTSGIRVLDVSNLSAPILRSTYPAGSVPAGPGSALSIAVSESTVFVADGYVGLQVLDVSNTSLPILRSTYPVGSGYAYGVAVSGPTVFVADGTGLQVLDVSNPSAPILRSTYPVSGVAFGVAVLGATVFLANVQAGLQVLDVSNTSAPILLNIYPVGPAGLGGARCVAVSESTVFVADEDAGLQVVDVSRGDLVGIPPLTSRPGQQVPITLMAQDLVTGEKLSVSFQLTLDNFPASPQATVSDQNIFPGQPLSLSLSTRLFKSSAPLGLSLSLSLQGGGVKPAWLSLTPNLQLLSTYSIGSGQAIGVAVSGSTVYVADYTGGLLVLDMSNPSAPILRSTYPAGSGYYANDVAVLGSTVFVADGPGGLQVLNVSNPSAPILRSTYSAYSNGMAVLGSTLFVANVNALLVLDVSNPSTPILQSTYPAGSGQTYSVAVLGSTAFVANVNALLVLDVSNLSTPILRSTCLVGGSEVTGVAVSGSTVFVEDATGLQVLDVSNLSAPILRSTYPASLGGARGLAVSGPMVFIADPAVGLQMLDVSNTSAPILRSTYPTGSGQARDVALAGSTVFVADGTAGLQVLDMSQQTLIADPSSMDVGNYPMRLTATDDIGGSSFIDFTIRVEGPPRLNGTILPFQQAWVGQPFNYFVPPDSFVDPNDDVISYSASLISGKSLPSWLQFNPLTIGFGGVPPGSEAGNLTITLSVTDHICPEIPTVNFTIAVGFLPVLGRRIPNQLAPIGSPYQFSVPKNSFFDPAGLVFSYLAQGVNNQPLPSWLEFNSSSLLFFGVANTSNVTVYTLQLIATNSAGGQVIASFMLRTDHFPVFNKMLSLPAASVHQPWVWTLPGNMFMDEDGDLLTYSATQEEGSVLPSWLSFNPITRAFTGVPLSAGFQTLKITAQDGYGGSNSTYFNITILSESQAGSVITPPSAQAGKLFVFQVNASSILSSGETFNYSASLFDGTLLPSWLQFIANNISFTGLPNSSDVGSYNITLIATDSQGAHYNVSFMLNVNPNYPPQVYLPISNQMARVNQLFVFYASRQTFVDLNGDNLTYTVNTLPSWLSFDSQQLKFWGTPARSDTDPLTARVNNIEFTAHDDESQTSTLFTISVQGTSNLLLFLQVGIPLLTGLTSLYKAYQNRALLLNRCCRNRIVKHEAFAITGEEFHVDLKTKPKEVGKIQVKLPKPEETKATAGCCSRLFRPCKRVMEESPDHLPPAYPLPTWLKYSDSNRLFSTGSVPRVKHPRFTVQVLNSARVIREELNVTIQTARV